MNVFTDSYLVKLVRLIVKKGSGEAPEYSLHPVRYPSSSYSLPRSCLQLLCHVQFTEQHNGKVGELKDIIYSIMVGEILSTVPNDVWPRHIHSVAKSHLRELNLILG